jgi:LPS sulfotransferase NodH
MYMKPERSYTIWFAQRTGSTLLCRALTDTGIAGKPNEWLNACDDISAFDIQNDLWDKGTTENGVFGIKFSMYRPLFDTVINLFRRLISETGKDVLSEIDVWNSVMPNCAHIFMTRRNKIRMAVSWWRAIQSGVWHKKHGSVPKAADIEDRYSFDAINQLYMECSMREAGIQELFDQAGIIPYTIFYEDFIKRYNDTVIDVLNFLGIEPSEGLSIANPYYERIADEISENWVQRFREERQSGWTNRGW